MKRLKIIGLILLILFVYFITNTLIRAGVFYKIVPSKNYIETEIKSPAGVEDMTLDGNTLYMSAHDRRNFTSLGAIYSTSNLENAQLELNNLTDRFKFKDFRPHGISFLKLNDSTKYLFVISHGDLKNEIYKFKISADSLLFLSKYNSTEFISPNDILAIAEDKFFITNDHTREKDWIRTIGDYANYPSGNVVYFDGKKATKVSDGIAYANGICLSKDNKTIFVASTTSKKLLEFETDIENKPLILKNEFKLSISPDNIEKDNEGNLWIGCHPKLLAFTAHAKDQTKTSPSGVLKIELDHTGKIIAEKTIYINDGSTLSGSSVSVPYNNKIFIGSVFENKILSLKQK